MISSNIIQIYLNDVEWCWNHVNILTWFQEGCKKGQLYEKFETMLTWYSNWKSSLNVIKRLRKTRANWKILNIFLYICISTLKGSKQDVGLLACSQIFCWPKIVFTQLGEGDCVTVCYQVEWWYSSSQTRGGSKITI